MRVAVIGARRARGGVGEHLARFFVECGTDVVALYGTTEATATEAVAKLASSTGHRAKPVWKRDALDVLGLDALVIAGPDRTHESWLEYALLAGFHVLCEKPLLWGGDGLDGRAARIARAFQERGLFLQVNTQWPFSLRTYEQLFPDVAASARTFFMRLSPRVTGRQMFRVSLSHPLSVLAHVVPDVDADVLDPEVRIEPDGREGTMQFVYAGAGRRLDCTVHLVQQTEPPREAAYGFDDHVGHRIVHGPGYDLELEGEGRRIPMPDPMPLLVRSFLAEAGGARPGWIDPAIAPGMRHLVELMRAVPREDDVRT